MDIYDIDPGQAEVTQSTLQLDLLQVEGETGAGKGETSWLALGLKLQEAVHIFACFAIHSNHCHHWSQSQSHLSCRGYQTCALCSSPCNSCDSIYWICIKATTRPQCNGHWCDSETRPKSHSVLLMWEDRSHQTQLSWGIQCLHHDCGRMFRLHPAWACCIGCSHSRHRSIRRGGRSRTRRDHCRVRFYILWRVNSMPLLQSKNCFTPLFINENPESNSSYFPEPRNDSSAIHPIHDSPPLCPKCIPKWEQQIPKHYVLAATPSERSLNLDIAIQTTDTGEVHAVSALLNSGATGLFIDPEFVWWNHLTMQSLAWAMLGKH